MGRLVLDDEATASQLAAQLVASGISAGEAKVVTDGDITVVVARDMPRDVTLIDLNVYRKIPAAVVEQAVKDAYGGL